MLYDPKWEKRAATKVPALSLAGLIQWLETQNPNTHYPYSNIHDCLLSRYFRARGYRWAYCGVGGFNYSWFFLPPLFRASYPSVMDDVAVSSPRTYGAALERARKISA